MSDSMIDGSCSDRESADEAPIFTPSTCSEAWSDEADSETSSDCGSFPRLPPGFFVAPVVDHDSKMRQVRAKKMSLWSNAHMIERPTMDKPHTTVVIKNVHSCSRRDDLCHLLDANGFAGKYDFAYVPANFKTMTSFGYAFVNFVDAELAEFAKSYFDNFQWHFCGNCKSLEVSWSDPHQGLEVHVERYRNCPVMHVSVADEYKPILLRNGFRIPFPPPTKSLSAPRDVRRRQTGRP